MKTAMITVDEKDLYPGTAQAIQDAGIEFVCKKCLTEDELVELASDCDVIWMFGANRVLTPEVLDAIRYHSTGTADMTDIAKIVFLADLIEPGRDFEGVEEIREASFRDLDRGMLLSYDNTIRYLLEDGLLIHPDAIAGYNQLAAKNKKKRK